MSAIIINRYLLKELLRHALLVGGVLLAIIWLTQSLRFLDLMVNKGFSLATFLHLTLLLVPFLLMFILPIALFAGVCILLKRLHDDSELPPLFGAGLSGFALLKPLALATFFTVVLGYGVSLYLFPKGQSAFKDLQYELRSNEGHLFLEAGTFNQLGKGVMVYLKKRASKYTMEGILVHDTRKAERPVTWMAKYGEIKATESGTPRLILRDGIRQDLSPKQVSMLQFREHTLDLARTFEAPKVRLRGAEERTLRELKEYGDLPQKYINQFNAEWHRRLLWPLTPIPLMLIAAGFLLQPRVRRQGVVRPVIMASIFVLVYEALLIMANSAAVKGSVLGIYGGWALPVGFSLFGLLLFLRGTRV